MHNSSSAAARPSWSSEEGPQVLDDAPLQGDAFRQPCVDGCQAFGRTLRQGGDAPQAGELELHRGQQAAHLVVQFARQPRALIFACRHQVIGQLPQRRGAFVDERGQPGLFLLLGPIGLPQAAHEQHGGQHRQHHQHEDGQPIAHQGVVQGDARRLLDGGGALEHRFERVAQVFPPVHAGVSHRLAHGLVALSVGGQLAPGIEARQLRVDVGTNRIHGHGACGVQPADQRERLLLYLAHPLPGRFLPPGIGRRGSQQVDVGRDLVVRQRLQQGRRLDPRVGQGDAAVQGVLGALVGGLRDHASQQRERHHHGQQQSGSRDRFNDSLEHPSPSGASLFVGRSSHETPAAVFL